MDPVIASPNIRFSESVMPNLYECTAKIQRERDAVVLGVGCLNLQRGPHFYRRYGDGGDI